MVWKQIRHFYQTCRLCNQEFECTGLEKLTDKVKCPHCSLEQEAKNVRSMEIPIRSKD